MDQFKVQSLIAQGQIVKAEDVNPDKAYLQVGVFQEGNRQIGPGNANAYAPYAIPLSQVGCNDQVYQTGIYDDYYWYITPTMVKSCTKVNDYPVFPTALPANLQGYKVVGTTWINNENPGVRYIGTVEITSPEGFYPMNLPWKTTGNITTWGNNPTPLSSPFAPGALVRDLGNFDNYVAADYTFIHLDEYSPGAIDMYLFVGSTVSQGTIVADYVTIDYEFLVIEGSDVKFTIY